MAFKQSTVNWIDFDFVDDSSGVGVTGLVHTDVTFKIAKAGVAGSVTKTTVAGDWIENSDGSYQLKLSAGDCDTLGSCKVIALITSGGITSKDVREYEVVANLESDTKAVVDAIAGYVDTEVAAIKAKTDNLPSDPADASDIAASFAAVTTTLTAISAKTTNLPSDPADASDIATSFASVTAQLARLLMLSGDNVVIDQVVYSGSDMTSCRLRGYDSKANADAAYASSPAGGTTGLLYTEVVTAGGYASGLLGKFLRTRDA